MPRDRPRVLSETTGLWMLRLYPPLLLQRVWVLEIGAGYRSGRMRVAKSLLTRNLNGTTFGGAIFAAADPIYPVLYWQALARAGERVQVWLKGASIAYRKPAGSALTLEFAITEQDLCEVRADLDRAGRCVRRHRSAAIDAAGATRAEIESEVYLRRLSQGQREVSGF